MRCTTVVLVGLAILICLAGLLLSTHLLVQHVSGQSINPVLEGLCDSAKANCSRVLSSRWGVFPPRPASHAAATPPHASAGSPRESAARQPHYGIPVAVLGLLYFSFLTAWFIGVGRPNERGRCWHLLVLLVVVAGCAFSAYFVYIMARLLKMWCPLCTITHAINFALLIIVVAMWPRRTRGRATEGSSATQNPAALTAVSPPAPHPSFRLVFLTVTLALMLWVSGGLAAGVLVFQGQARLYNEIIENVKQYPDILVQLYEKAEVRAVTLHPDELPPGGTAGTPWTVVVFADMQCVRCRQYKRFLTEEVKPLFGDRLWIVLKHYPLCRDCNRFAESSFSPEVCEAAYAVEAARVQGGIKAAERMHGRILAQSDDLLSVDYAALAAALGLDGPRLLRDMHDDAAVRQRVTDDVELANRLGVDGTPASFLNGRRVPEVAARNLGFWKMIAGSAGPGQGPGTQAASALPASVPAK